MLLRFWGTRGSIAAPGPDTTRFGGNTSCVELVTKAGKRFIFDCGTGARALGAHLMAHGPKPVTANIMLSHTHWDHIQGFPFFAPLFVPGNRITVCGPNGAKSSLPEVLAGQMEFTYFPVELAQLGAAIQYVDLSEGTHEIDGVRVSTQFLNHPAIALGFRVEADGVSFAYMCDHEPYRESLWRSDVSPGKIESILHDGDRRHAEFLRDCDVVVHDSQYTPEEYPSKKNWGHSTWTYTTQIAAAAGVKRLFLTHHDPTHSDAVLAEIEAMAQAFAKKIRPELRVSCAAEGYEEEFAGSAAGDSETAGPAIEVRGDMVRDANESLSIMVIDDDEDLRILVRKALTRMGHKVIEAEGGEEGLAMLEKQLPDLLLLDLRMPAPDGFEVLKTLRARPATKALPVIVLTALGDEESVRESFAAGATDFLNKPFTPPQLDARVWSSIAHSPRMQSARVFTKETNV